MRSRRVRCRAWVSAVSTVAGAVLVGMVFTSTPASAHVEVRATASQSSPNQVTLIFTADVEKAAASIAGARVTLPAGIAATDVGLMSAPQGWTMTRGAGEFTVAGQALKPQLSLTFSVIVAAPTMNDEALTFETLQNYSDGTVSRWTAELSAGSLTGLPSSSTGDPPYNDAPNPASAVGSPEPFAAEQPVAGHDGVTVETWILVFAIALIAGGVVALVFEQRRQQ